MSKKLTAGKRAPAFSLTDKTGQVHSLKSLREATSNWLVLFFYPKDDTPGCTIESKKFSKDLKKFEKIGATVVGISGGDDNSKQKFCKKHNLKTLMLSDSDFAVAKKYGCYGQKAFMGRKYNGIFRKTFVLDKSGAVLKVYDTVKPEEHSLEVFQFLNDQPE